MNHQKYLSASLRSFVLICVFVSTAWAQTTTAQNFNVITKNSISSGNASAGLSQMIQIKSESTEVLSLSVTPIVKMKSVKIGPQSYQRLRLKDGSETEKYGSPRLPYLSRFIAIPDGATVKISLTSKQTHDIDNVRIEPAPPPYEDNLDAKDLPRIEDTKAYQSTAFTPTLPYEFKEVFAIGGVRTGILKIFPAQFQAATKKLRIYDQMNLSITFTGGSSGVVKNFYYQNLKLAGMFLNQQSLRKRLDFSIIKNYVNEDIPSDVFPYATIEYLIVTHEDFRDAADRLAEWKNAKGIDTVVADLTETGTTKEDITAFIKDVSAQSGGRLQYVALMGDVEFIPTYYYHMSCLDDGTCTTSTEIATDFFYMETTGDIYPDFAYGRISVDTADEAENVVDKILEYEQNPPRSFSYYNTFTFPGYFQDTGTDSGTVAYDGIDDRAYVETLEAIRDPLITLGKTVERLYYYSLSNNANGPQFYDDGVTPLPADLLVQYDSVGNNIGYPWDADADDINAAINAGRAFVLHRDHGGWNGWSTPTWRYGSFSSLSNTMLPIVFSINCSTGLFDHEVGWWSYITVDGFAEQLLRLETYGAPSLIAASRATSTSKNNTMAKGLFDAVWDEVVTDSSHVDADTLVSTPITRLGDMLNYAKTYVALKHSSPEEHIYEYSVMGDPTLEIMHQYPWDFIFSFPWNTGLKLGDLENENFIMHLEIADPRKIEGLRIKMYWDPNQIAMGELIDTTVLDNGKYDLQYKITGAQLLTPELKEQFQSAAELNNTIKLVVTAPGYRPYMKTMVINP